MCFCFLKNINIYYVLIALILLFLIFLIFKIFFKKKANSSNLLSFIKINFNKNNPSFINELEKTLYNADFSTQIVKSIISKVKISNDFNTLKEDLKNILLREANLYKKELLIDKNPYLIVLVGVNGVGKTTMAARLAKYYKKQGKKIMLIGADTFRAAAVEQLEHWAKKLDVLFFSKGANSDIGANVYEGISKGIEYKVELIIIDTGGRIHTKDNLMNELKKLSNVIKKKLPDAPHLNLLVLDANMGQNLVVQSKVFNEFIDISGLAITKLDGSAKGGALFKICKTLNLPVYFIGTGESEDSIMKFDSEYFINKII